MWYSLPGNRKLNEHFRPDAFYILPSFSLLTQSGQATVLDTHEITQTPRISTIQNGFSSMIILMHVGLHVGPMCNCQNCRVRILSFMFGNITEASNFWNYQNCKTLSLVRGRQSNRMQPGLAGSEYVYHLHVFITPFLAMTVSGLFHFPSSFIIPDSEWEWI